jgi:acetyl esterase/lipase
MRHVCILLIASVCLAPCALLAAEETPVDIVPDIVYGHKAGMALTMDLYQPKTTGNGAAVLFMVSGGWRSNWTAPERGLPLFRQLIETGFKVFAVRHGSSPKFNIPEIVEDVRMAARFVRAQAGKYGVDANRLGVYGGSAGGHLSLMLGTTSADAADRVAAVVAYFPPTDLRGWVSEDPESNKSYPALRFAPAKAPDYSPLLQVTPDDAPTLLIHGDKDPLVPLSHSEKILAEFKAKNVPAELLVIPGGGHGFKGEDEVRARNAMVAWFTKYLAK